MMQKPPPEAPFDEQVAAFRRACGDFYIGSNLVEAYGSLAVQVSEWTVEAENGCTPTAEATLSKRKALLAWCDELLEETKVEAVRRSTPDWRPTWSIPEDAYAL